jgi:hypothetical protein
MLLDRVRRIAILAAVLILVTGCGGTGDETAQTEAIDSLSSEDAAQVDSIISQSLREVAQDEAATFPCNLFTSEEMGEMVGAPVDSGSYTFVNRSENDIEWKSQACAWSTQADDNTVVDAWVSLPAHFDSGEVACHPMLGATELSGVARGAWWQFMDGYGLGTLRVCTDAALLEVKLDRGTSATEAEVQELARRVADQIVARLPGATA